MLQYENFPTTKIIQGKFSRGGIVQIRHADCIPLPERICLRQNSWKITRLMYFSLLVFHFYRESSHALTSSTIIPDGRANSIGLNNYMHALSNFVLKLFCISWVVCCILGSIRSISNAAVFSRIPLFESIRVRLPSDTLFWSWSSLIFGPLLFWILENFQGSWLQNAIRLGQIVSMHGIKM
jgi:hypothetical protein